MTFSSPARSPARRVASHWLGRKYAGTVTTARFMGSPRYLLMQCITVIVGIGIGLMVMVWQ